MTHFKVSDEALDVALRASFVKACELEGKPFDEDEYQGRKSKADNSARQQAKEMIRASIEAALPVMFGEAGLFVASSRRSDYETHGINPFMYYGTNRALAEQDAAAIDGEVLTAYVLKEPK